MNSPPSACAPPSEGSATKRIRGGGAKRGAPRKGKPRTVLGQAKHASRRRRLKSGKPARHGRRGSSRTNAQAGPNWGKTKQRPRETASRIAVRAAQAQNCAADGRRMAGKKAQPTPSPLRLATEARAPFFASRKSQRAARGVRARPQFSRSRARRSQRNLYFCNAPRTRPTDRVGSRPAPGRSNKPHPRRGAKRAFAASRAPRATEPQDNTKTKWKTSRGRMAGQAHRAQSGAPRKSTGEATRKQRPAPKPFPNQRRQPAYLPAPARRKPANRRRNLPSFKIQTLSAHAASADREKSSIGFDRDR